MKKWTSIVIIAIIVVLGYSLFYYNFTFKRTGAVVTLVEKNEHSLTLKFELGETKTVKSPSIIYPYLEVGNRYFVNIRSNRLRDPFIVKIEPIK